MGGVRRPKPYTLDRIWSVIKKEPGSTSRIVIHRLQWPKKRVWNGLHSLKVRGLAKVEGKGPQARWTALGRKPVCHWGSHENSVANLLEVPEVERMARLGIERRIKPPPVIESACALQNCWSVLNIARTGGD